MNKEHHQVRFLHSFWGRGWKVLRARQRKRAENGCLWLWSFAFYCLSVIFVTV